MGSEDEREGVARLLQAYKRKETFAQPGLTLSQENRSSQSLNLLERKNSCMERKNECQEAFDALEEPITCLQDVSFLSQDSLTLYNMSNA